MATPTIIFITRVVPYPPSAGNEIRILKMIAWLKKRGYRVILFLNMDSLDPGVRQSLEKVVDGVHCAGENIPDAQFSRVDKKGFFRSVITKAGDRLAEHALIRGFMKRHIFSLMPGLVSPLVKKRLCPDKLIEMTRYYCSKYRPFAVIAEYIFTAPCLDATPPGTLKLVDTHDMFSRRKQQVISYGIEDFLHCTPEEERDYLLKSDVVMAIQQNEAEMFKNLVPEREVVTVGIDYDTVDKVDNSWVSPGSIMFVGSENPINVHGLKAFYKNAWPLIRNRNSKAVLRVIGKIGSKFRFNDPRVQIAGWVEDLDAEYRKAALVINPTVAGTGLKIKSVEALCRAKPLVATPNSVEGLFFRGEQPFIACRNWMEFSDAVITLLESGDKRIELQKRALGFAQEHFGTEQVYGPLSRFLPRPEQCLSDEDATG